MSTSSQSLSKRNWADAAAAPPHFVSKLQQFLLFETSADLKLSSKNFQEGNEESRSRTNGLRLEDERKVSFP